MRLERRKNQRTVVIFLFLQTSTSIFQFCSLGQTQNNGFYLICSQVLNESQLPLIDKQFNHIKLVLVVLPQSEILISIREENRKQLETYSSIVSIRELACLGSVSCDSSSNTYIFTFGLVWSASNCSDLTVLKYL